MIAVCLCFPFDHRFKEPDLAQRQQPQAERVGTYRRCRWMDGWMDGYSGSNGEVEFARLVPCG
jgi:hypothetical protein